MFLSLGKRVLLLKNEKRAKNDPFDLTPYFHIHYIDLKELQENWYRKIPKYLEDLKKYYMVL